MRAYQGVSQLDHVSPVQVIVTGINTKSQNAKTGDMAQVWFLRSDMHPMEARKTGCDDAICGTCPHRNGACYVEIGKAPSSVYRAMSRGNYPDVTPQDVPKAKAIRLGAYGDPACAPFEVSRDLVKGTKRHTGYTHQWKACDTRFSQLVMASCDTETDREQAKAKGYRTFRVRKANTPLLPGEIECPASVNDKVQCVRCGLCNGTTKGNRPDVSIVVHGNGKDKFLA